MAKQTILEMTQDILSDLSGDAVNSITDTVESMQVAQIIKSTYESLMGRKNWPHLRKLFVLDASGDVTRPSHMKVPEDIKELVRVNYDKQKATDTKPDWKTVEYLTPDEFLIYTNGRNTSMSNTDEITDFTGVKLLIMNDKAPTYYTSFDDEYLVFDSYDSAVSATLTSAKTQCIAYIMPTVTLTDSFILDLPSEMFSAVLADCKSTCFVRIKEMPEGKAEQQGRKGLNFASNKSWQVDGGWNFPNYGRRGKK